MLEVNFQKIINKVFPKKMPEKIAVAVSGGIDSMALIFLLNNLYGKKNKITALIVDHNFRENSDKEAKLVYQILQNNNINCQILTSYLEKNFKANIEANLRQVRYDLLNKFCVKNKIKHLFIGHHKQDLAENFLIRLFRGSGIDGLAATDYESKFHDIKIIRPLLDFNKEDLKNYLEKNNINWVEDESNKEEKYLRNKIRNFLESLDNKEVINKRIAKASNSILANKKIVEKYLKEKSGDILEFNEMGYFLLNIKNFCELEEEIAKKYLALSLMEISGNYYKPRLSKLENLYSKILVNKDFKTTFYGCVIEQYDNSKLIIYREKSAIKTDQEICQKICQKIWDNRFRINTKQDFEITTIDAAEFNKLEISYNIKKEIIYTLPVFRKDKRIVAIPHLNYYSGAINNIDIQFDKKTLII